MVADDLDGVLVGAHSAVAAQAPELALDGAGSCGVGAILVLGQGEVRQDRKSTRLNSSHITRSRMPSSA